MSYNVEAVGIRNNCVNMYLARVINFIWKVRSWTYLTNHTRSRSQHCNYVFIPSGVDADMHIQMHPCTHAHANVLYPYKYTYIHRYVCALMHTCMHTFICIYVLLMFCKQKAFYSPPSSASGLVDTWLNAFDDVVKCFNVENEQPNNCSVA